jgi:hypothetical protein
MISPSNLSKVKKAREKAEQDTASVGDLRKRLHQAETALSENITVVTLHTTVCCSMPVVDITFMKYQSANVTSLRVVQQNIAGP